MCLEISMSCIDQEWLLKFHFSIFCFSYFRLRWYIMIKQTTNCSLLGTDKIRGQIFRPIFEKHMTDLTDTWWDPEQRLTEHKTIDWSKRKVSHVPSRDKLFSINIIFISVHSHLDRTAVQLSAHADMIVPCQRMNSDITGMEWREDLMNNNGIPIKVAPKYLKWKLKFNDILKSRI